MDAYTIDNQSLRFSLDSRGQNWCPRGRYRYRLKYIGPRKLGRRFNLQDLTKEGSRAKSGRSIVHHSASGRRRIKCEQRENVSFSESFVTSTSRVREEEPS